MTSRSTTDLHCGSSTFFKTGEGDLKPNLKPKYIKILQCVDSTHILSVVGAKTLTVQFKEFEPDTKLCVQHLYFC